MNFLSPEELVTLKAEFARSAYTNLADIDRWNYLHRPEGQTTNPAQREQVPVTFSIETMLAFLGSDSAANVGNWANLGLLMDTVSLQDHSGALRLVSVLVAFARITSAEATAIRAWLNSTVADPNYSSTVPGPTPCFRLFGGKTWTASDGSSVTFVTLEDVALARS